MKKINWAEQETKSENLWTTFRCIQHQLDNDSKNKKKGDYKLVKTNKIYSQND